MIGELMAQMQIEIDQRGFALRRVDDERGGYTYTVGLAEQDLPEVMVRGEEPLATACCVRVGLNLQRGALRAQDLILPTQLELQPGGPRLQCDLAPAEVAHAHVPVSELRLQEQAGEHDGAQVRLLMVQLPGGAIPEGPILPLRTIGELTRDLN